MVPLSYGRDAATRLAATTIAALLAWLGTVAVTDAPAAPLAVAIAGVVTALRGLAAVIVRGGLPVWRALFAPDLTERLGWTLLEAVVGFGLAEAAGWDSAAGAALTVALTAVKTAVARHVGNPNTAAIGGER